MRSLQRETKRERSHRRAGHTFPGSRKFPAFNAPINRALPSPSSSHPARNGPPEGRGFRTCLKFRGDRLSAARARAHVKTFQTPPLSASFPLFSSSSPPLPLLFLSHDVSAAGFPPARAAARRVSLFRFSQPNIGSAASPCLPRANISHRDIFPRRSGSGHIERRWEQ